MSDILLRREGACMIPLIPPSDDEVFALKTVYRTTKDVRIRTRAQIMLLAFDGVSAPKIATIVNLDPERVRNHLKRYRDEGVIGLPDTPRSGRPRIATPEYIALAVATVRRRPWTLGLNFSVWTLERLVAYLKEETQITVSDETLRTHLQGHGISFSRPQHTVSSPDEAYAQKKQRLKQRATP